RRVATVTTPASVLFFLILFAALYVQLVGRDCIGSPSRKRPRSSAISFAVEYRCSGSFSRHFITIVSRSVGRLLSSLRTGSGSSFTILNRISMLEYPEKGGLSTSSSY